MDLETELFYFISVRYRTMILNGFEERILLANQKILEYLWAEYASSKEDLNCTFLDFKQFMQRGVKGEISYEEKCINDFTDIVLGKIENDQPMMGLMTDKNSVFDEQFITQLSDFLYKPRGEGIKPSSCVGKTHLYGNIIKIDSFRVMRQLPKMDLLNLALCVYGVWISTKDSTLDYLFSTLQKKRDYVEAMILERQKSVSRDDMYWIISTIEILIEKALRAESHNLQQQNFLDNLKFLFETSLKYEVFASNIEENYPLVPEKFTYVNELIKYSVFLPNINEFDKKVDYIHMLSPFELWSNIGGYEVPEQKNINNGKTFKIEDIADSQCVYGFLLELNHENFSLEEAMQIIERMIKDIIIKNNIVKKNDTRNILTTMFSSKSKKKVHKLYHTMVVWDLVNQGDSIRNAAKQMQDFDPSKEQDFKSYYREVARSYNNINTEIKEVAIKFDDNKSI